ncbi:uncharacterized protein LOC124262951 [Haliotis rubra]|uniref:uncharacterized protein LOC124262951 n=1 Tax=Haliotis rubra TaxID=36100 RepID=UPI001EE4F2FC|nr:uncharacterized protein LOC124262951 [Haliotis rubra]
MLTVTKSTGEDSIYLLGADMTSKAVHFILPFLLMSSLLAELITQGSWRKVTSQRPPESGLWRVYHGKGVIQWGVLCGQDDHCNSFQNTFFTRVCSGFLGRVRAHGVTERRKHSVHMPCPEDEGYKLHRTRSGIPLCWKDFMYKIMWKKARGRCHADGAELIIADTQEKVDFLFQHVKELNRGIDYSTWIGLVKEEHDGKITYRWLNNSTDIAWGYREPDIHDNQECGEIDSDGVSDMQCYKHRKYICEKN